MIETHAPGTFCWADLGTTDAAAAKRFYTGLFGWSFEDMPMGPDADYTMFDLGGKMVAALYQLSPEERSQGRPPSWLSYIAVESADQAAKLAQELGGTAVMEPLDVFDSGRMALIQDPTGAMVGLWEPRAHIGAGLTGEPNAMCWNELATKDTAKAARFYSGLFGWKADEQAMEGFTYTVFRQGEHQRGGMMQIAPEWGPMPPHWTVYCAVDDCDAKAALALSLGGKVPMPPSDIPGVGRFAVVQDLQGAAFAIIKLLPG
ncbi:MAG: VOC family protein [Gemmatimonadales bacterium]